MASIRLRIDQIERLRKSGNASAVIRHAISRYKRGDFQIPEKNNEKFGNEKLKVFPLWKDIAEYQDWQIRAILDKHFSIKDAVLQKHCDEELAKVNREIEQLMKLYTNQPYILEEQDE
jgi:hypothetical protein